jgi:hypothetical protein
MADNRSAEPEGIVEMPNVIQPPKDHTIVPTSHIEAEKLPPVKFPEGAHYGQIAEHKNPAISQSRKLLQLVLERDHAELNQLRSTPDPRVPVAAHRQELANEAAKRKAEFLKAHEAAVKAVEAEARSTEAHLEAMGGFKANPQAAEVRAVLREMKQQEREAIVGKAVETLDEGILACVFNGAHPLTVGVSREFLAAQRNYYLQKIAPDYLAEKADLAATRERLEQAKPLVEATYDKLGQGIEQFAEQISKAEAIRKTKH